MTDRLHSLITDFTYGELSPRWRARVSGGNVATPLGTSAALSEVYQSGCQELTNMVVLPQGGVAKREGAYFGAYPDDTFAAVVNDGENYRLSSFAGPNIDAVLLWKDKLLRIFNPSFRPMTLFQDVAIPYSDAELADLYFIQSAAELVILHPQYRPRILRAQFGGYTLEETTDRLRPPLFDFGNTIEAGRSPVIITRKYSLFYEMEGATKTATMSFNISNYPIEERDAQRYRVTLQKNDDAKSADELLTKLKNHPVTKNDTVSVTVTALNTFEIEYEYEGHLGDRSGNLEVERFSGDGLPTLELTDQRLAAGEEGTTSSEPLWSGPFYLLHNGTYYLCDVSHRSAIDNEPGVGVNWQLYWTDKGTSPTAEDIELDPGPWAADKAYYPQDRGWPSIGTFHEQRLILNGPSSVPNAVAASKTTQTDFLDFRQGIDPADGLLFLLANERGLRINWLLSQRRLFLGTTEGLYIQTEIPFTPANVSFERHSVNPSTRLNALPVNGEIYYAEENKRRARKVQYVNDVDQWEGRDMTIFAEHLFTTDQQITDWAFQTGIDPVIWTVRSDGVLLSLTYDAQYNVVGWAKHSLGDRVLRVETLYVNEKELLVLLVQRQLWDATTQSYRLRPVIEVIENTSRNMFKVIPDFTVTPKDQTGDLIGQEAEGRFWSPHVDSWRAYIGDGTTTVVVGDQFAQRDVAVVENGVYLGIFRGDDAGQITLDTETLSGSSIVAGFNYIGRLIPNREQFVDVDGTSQSQKIRWTKPVLRLFASTLPKLNGQRARERSQDDPYDTFTELFTGDVELTNLGSDTGLVIEADLPLPVMISGIFGLLTTEGG